MHLRVEKYLLQLLAVSYQLQSRARSADDFATGAFGVPASTLVPAKVKQKPNYLGLRYALSWKPESDG